MDQNKPKRNLLLQPFAYMLLGFFFIALSLVLPWIVDHLVKNKKFDPNGVFIKVLNWIGDEGLTIGAGALVIGVLLYIATKWIEDFWGHNIQPLLDDYAKKIRASTTEAQSTIVQFKADITEKIRDNNLDLAIGHSDHEAIQSRLPAIYERAFGEHCNKEKGLYKHINSTIGKFLDPRVPHRSEYFQEITISELNGKLKWSESCSFSLHTIALDNEYKTPFDGGIPPHTFSYTTSAKYQDLNELLLEIYVDDQPFASTAGKLEVMSTDPIDIRSTDPNIQVKICGDEIQVSIRCEISIGKSQTKIKLVEHSILEDSFFISRINEPTYGLTHSINLPDNWEFEFFYVTDNAWVQPEHKPSKRTVRKEGWVMPGIFVCCRWRKS